MLPELFQKDYVVKVDSSQNITAVMLRFSSEQDTLGRLRRVAANWAA